MILSVGLIPIFLVIGFCGLAIIAYSIYASTKSSKSGNIPLFLLVGTIVVLVSFAASIYLFESGRDFYERQICISSLKLTPADCVILVPGPPSSQEPTPAAG